MRNVQKETINFAAAINHLSISVSSCDFYTVKLSLKHPLIKKVCLCPPGKFVFMSWDDVIMMSGAFISIWLEQDGALPF